MKDGTVRTLGKTTDYPTTPSPKILEWFPTPEGAQKETILFECHEFTSLCPKTGQPDFGTLTVAYIPRERCLESKSLKLYLGAYRKTGAFWEDLVARIHRDIQSVIQSTKLQVTATQNVRGGIGLRVELTRYYYADTLAKGKIKEI